MLRRYKEAAIADITLKWGAAVLRPYGYEDREASFALEAASIVSASGFG
jgi:hypothetical protein